jgi:CRP-like cAMP-binding protein
LALPPPTPAVRNKLLAALPSGALARLLPKLHAVALPVRKTLLVPQERIEAVYFIESGWVSMVAHLDDGTQAEVGLVGFEGMIGLPLVVGVDTAFTDTYMQASGAGLQMEAMAFQRELEDNPALHRLLLRYSEAMHAQAMQTAACNGRHNLEQRLARWLLMAHDRSEGDVLPLTQEFLSLMLCVYRPSITTAARFLQRAGIITYGNSRRAALSSLTGKRLRTPPAIVTKSCRRDSINCSDSRGTVRYQTVKLRGRCLGQ